mmetsp:Transcript_10169/g.10046  ORF Transcript_10169/g.10046 Transcript_10169/m.10046 type:complete len:162 (-) Transcript_10169:560-1045(-)
MLTNISRGLRENTIQNNPLEYVSLDPNLHKNNIFLEPSISQKKSQMITKSTNNRSFSQAQPQDFEMSKLGQGDTNNLERPEGKHGRSDPTTMIIKKLNINENSINRTSEERNDEDISFVKNYLKSKSEVTPETSTNTGTSFICLDKGQLTIKQHQIETTVQ